MHCNDLQRYPGDYNLYDSVVAQLNLPSSYTGMDLKSDMIEWIKKNNNLAQVVTLM